MHWFTPGTMAYRAVFAGGPVNSGSNCSSVIPFSKVPQRYPKV